MAKEQTRDPFLLRQSGAILKAWRAGGSGIETPPPKVADRLLKDPGVHQLTESLFAVTTTAGDPAVFDVALALSRALSDETVWPGDPGSTRTAIVPGVVELAGDGVATLEPDPISRHLEEQAPNLEPGSYLTSRAHQTLEYPVEELAGPALQTASGATAPLVRAGAVLLDQSPWRNREVLGQPSAWVERADAGAFEELLEEPLLRIVGPAGVGKTRLVAETLRSQRRTRLWLVARPPRVRGPSLAEQVLRQLLLPSPAQHADPLHPRLTGDIDRVQVRRALEKVRRGERQQRILNERAVMTLRHLLAAIQVPVSLVVDDLHSSQDHDLDLVAELADLATGESANLRLLLVARSGLDSPGRLAGAPGVDLGPLGDSELERLTRQLTTGFALPEESTQRLLDAVAGRPFALEESLFALVHDKSLRRVYGSYFFAGDTTRGFEPSERFVRHVDAEVGRLTEPWPVRLLAVLETAAPAAELTAAADPASPETAVAWPSPLIAAGLVASASSPWGDGVTLSFEAERSALSALLPRDNVNSLRRLVGRQLAAASTKGQALWQAYRLLAGDPDAVAPLIELCGGSEVEQVPAAELLEALGYELAALRRRDPEPAVELELLWRLLPLARKMGTLRAYQAELGRATELATSDPPRLLALASIKAEMDQEEGRHQEAEVTIRRALEAAADAEPRRKALLLIQLGRLLIRQRRQAEARQLFTSVREAVGAAVPNPLTATCDFYLGNIALAEGLLDDAETHHRAALDERQRQGLERPTGSSLSALGAVAIARGNYPQALAHYRQAADILETHGKAGEKSFALLGEARALNRLGDFTGATRPVRQALDLREGRDDTAGEALARLAVARNYLDIGQPDVALEQARKAHFQLNMISAEEHLPDTESLLGRVHLSQRRHESAQRRFEAARKAHDEAGNLKEAALDLAGLLEIALAERNTPAVRRLTTDLKNILPDLPRSDVSDTLAYRLFLGLDYLTSAGLKVGNPLTYLERAYRGVLEKAEHLSHEQRQRYLFQIPDNQEILAAATDRGLATR